MLNPGERARKMTNQVKTVVFKISKTSTSKTLNIKVGLQRTAKFSTMSIRGPKARIDTRTKAPKHGQR